MNKRDFLKATGLLGAASLIPFKKTAAGTGSSCVLIPSETPGPFPLDLTDNNFYFRQDIRENRDGVQLNQKIKIIGLDNCLPMQNVRVNIWHCDKGGSYSGYSTQAGNTTNEVGQTWLRGYQITDANGEVELITIFPGWYNGRVCHIHFQVFVSSSYSAVSQLTYDHATKNALYAANSSIYTKGADPLSPADDGIFSGNYQYQLATLTPNATTGGYDSYLEVTVQGSGSQTTGYIERQNAKQFSLGQNYPNPYSGETTIPFTLQQQSEVTIELWDLMGRRVATVVKQNFSAGEQRIAISPKSLNIPAGNYVYQLIVKNSSGTFKDCKMMTAAR